MRDPCGNGNVLCLDCYQFSVLGLILTMVLYFHWGKWVRVPEICIISYKHTSMCCELSILTFSGHFTIFLLFYSLISILTDTLGRRERVREEWGENSLLYPVAQLHYKLSAFSNLRGQDWSSLGQVLLARMESLLCLDHLGTDHIKTTFLFILCWWLFLLWMLWAQAMGAVREIHM